MARDPQTTPPASPAANDTAVVRLARAAVLVGLGWCWARFGLDWLAGMAAIAAVSAPFALAAREVWRTGRRAGRC